MTAEEYETWTPEDEPPKSSSGVYNPLEFLYDDEENPWWMLTILIVAGCLASLIILPWALIKRVYGIIRNWALSTDSTID